LHITGILKFYACYYFHRRNIWCNVNNFFRLIWGCLSNKLSRVEERKQKQVLQTRTIWYGDVSQISCLGLKKKQSGTLTRTYTIYLHRPCQYMFQTFQYGWVYPDREEEFFVGIMIKKSSKKQSRLLLLEWWQADRQQKFMECQDLLSIKLLSSKWIHRKWMHRKWLHRKWLHHKWIHR